MPVDHIMRFAAVFGLVNALALPAATAQAPRWYVDAGSTGECGDECYTPPTAWVYSGNGAFAFGVQCDGQMVLGGPAMAVPSPPFSQLEMRVDGRSYGVFAVQQGLADVYVGPTEDYTQDWYGAVRPALAGGSVLQLWIGPSALLEFGLGGSRAALDGVDQYCVGGRAAASDGQTIQPNPPVQPAQPVTAQGPWSGQSWQAYSSISMAITGNITTTPTEIIFGNGARLPVRVVADNVPGAWGFGGEVSSAAILQVTPPTNPRLLEGNTLCGMQTTYIALAVDSRGGMTMTVFAGPSVPQSSQSNDVCAMYDYGRP